ncbi:MULTISPECIES: SPFH domain-containing protein [Pyrobaculum]|uniref:Band 7 protein n=2 Tax=Pyrobaculum arsenaticum TaxID=121277 RepID=A4WMX7_PYRAR|nr:SPFH domain-containing protein [Pyrobaculum arsenaticum]ABP51744.1 band 7 protein [Pyrobaculum arsenaticum DSM 13514]MCY0890062.1 SPFH domain-containing protein [Pyrobaculum arsenaticum]NYR16063.1 prohibitin family protein [Pyrobaculum arsenaticum]
MSYIPVQVRASRVPRRAATLFVALFLALVIAAVVAALSVYSLPAGVVAVVVDPVSGTISKPVLGPALGVKAPWAYLIEDTYAIEILEFAQKEKATGKWVFSAPEVLTKDGVVVTVEMVVRYRIVPERFDELIKRFPQVDYDDKVLVPKARQLIRDIISKVTLDELIASRDVIAKQIEETYKTAVENDPAVAGLVAILDVNVQNFVLPQQITDAINRKVAAQQDAIRAQFERQRVEELARANFTRTVLAAMAEANATITRARAQAMQVMLVANATRTAIEMIIRAAGANATEAARLAELYIYLAGLREVAQTGNVQIVAVSGGGQVVPVIPLAR